MNRPTTYLLAATALFAAACQKDNTPIKTSSGNDTTTSAAASSVQGRGNSLVRVVNAVNNGAEVAVKNGDATLFDVVKAGTVTEYKEVSSDLAKFSVRAPGSPDGMNIAEKDRLLADGNRYTVVLVAKDVATRVLRVEKDDVIPDSGKARVRVIHAAPGGPEFDIAVTGAKDKLFSGLNFESTAGYKDVTPAKVDLDFYAKGTTKSLLHITGLDLKRSTATTIVVTGAGKLSWFMFTDAMMAKTP